jgi:putative ABC transport system ATP-binding protein
VDALKDVSIQIDRGELLVMLGPSGSGKTTLLNLIGGINSASSGRITVDTMEITSLDERGLNQYRRNNVGFIFQFFNLIPTLTVAENIELAAELVDKPRGIQEVWHLVLAVNRKRLTAKILRSINDFVYDSSTSVIYVLSAGSRYPDDLSF